MPFFQNSGLFLFTSRPYRLRAEVIMLLTLMDELDKLTLAERVAWITPEDLQ